MTYILTISEARAALPDIVRRVESGEEVTITRHGPVAVIVRPDALCVRRADTALAAAGEFGAALDRARRAPLPEPSMSVERAEELVADIRAARSARSS